MNKINGLLVGTALLSSLWLGSGVAHADDAAPAVDTGVDAGQGPSSNRAPCNPHDGIYTYFPGGYYHCSKDGVLTTHHVT